MTVTIGVAAAAALMGALTLSSAAWSDTTTDPQEPIVRPIAFPVLGPVTYSDDYGDCRDECSRLHQGNDLIGVKMQPLLAAVDGVVTAIHDDKGTHGIGVTITDADGWTYMYLHVNNDPPGDIELSDSAADEALLARWHMPTAITVGAPVRAGQVIAWMGNSGNAEHSVPHLHFEIAGPDGVGINPFPSLRRAEWISRCLDPSALPQRPTPVLSPPDVVAGTLFRFPTSTGRGSFTLSAAGGVLADGDAAGYGDPNRTNPACDGEGPVLTARTMPEVAPVDAEAVTDTTVIGVAPGAEVPTTSVAADPRTTLPPDIEDGDDG
ncbi:MAG: M23 family metallopeptidase [Acidimicrobiia bacterium]